MKTIEEIRKLLVKYKREIKDRFKAEILGLFGSYVRGDATDDSDLDILVRFEDGATLFDLVGLGDFLEEKMEIKVDIVSERALRQELKDFILKEVVPID